MVPIKDAIDLIAMLVNKSNDRKLASELLQIQQFILTVQSKYAAVQSKSLALENDKAKLEFQILEQKKIINSLIEDIKQLQKGSSDDAGGFSSGVVIS